MRRVAVRQISLTVMAILAMSGQAAAFTPVPIPTPRTNSPVAALAAHR